MPSGSSRVRMRSAGTMTTRRDSERDDGDDAGDDRAAVLRRDDSGDRGSGHDDRDVAGGGGAPREVPQRAQRPLRHRCRRHAEHARGCGARAPVPRRRGPRPARIAGRFRTFRASFPRPDDRTRPETERTPRAPARARLPLLRFRPGGVGLDGATRGAGDDRTGLREQAAGPGRSARRPCGIAATRRIRLVAYGARLESVLV